MHKIFTMPFAQVYPHYVKKIERKGRSVKELHEVITWLTGFSEAALKKHIKSETTFKDFSSDVASGKYPDKDHSYE